MGRPGFEPGLLPCEGNVLTRLNDRPSTGTGIIIIKIKKNNYSIFLFFNT